MQNIYLNNTNKFKINTLKNNLIYLVYYYVLKKILLESHCKYIIRKILHAEINSQSLKYIIKSQNKTEIKSIYKQIPTQIKNSLQAYLKSLYQSYKKIIKTLQQDMLIYIECGL